MENYFVDVDSELLSVLFDSGLSIELDCLVEIGRLANVDDYRVELLHEVLAYLPYEVLVDDFVPDRRP